MTLVLLRATPGTPVMVPAPADLLLMYTVLYSTVLQVGKSDKKIALLVRKGLKNNHYLRGHNGKFSDIFQSFIGEGFFKKTMNL